MSETGRSLGTATGHSMEDTHRPSVRSLPNGLLLPERRPSE
jgi:hypothetical protein